jgi:TRAP-type C4-dicarboxylate transport system substrate-binding protein
MLGLRSDLTRRLLPVVLALSGVLAVTTGAVAQSSTTVKLATLVPERSVWGNLLRELTAQWKEDTSGRVSTRIYPGGVAGDDPDMVRKMRIGQLHAATLTVTGLAEIDPAFNIFSIPLFYESYEEYFHILETLEPVLRQRLESKGFILLHWGHGGWIHLFTTRPVRTVEDLRELKLFVWAGNDRLVSWWKDNGFRPVPLAATDIMPALQTGMVEALPSTPLAALSLQWYRSTPNMLDLGLAPLVGATVITERTWRKISDADQQAIRDASQRAAERFSTEIPEQDAKAILEMEKRGLTVTEVADPQVEARWRSEAERFATNYRDAFIPSEIYAQAYQARQDFRGRQAPASAE